MPVEYTSEFLTAGEMRRVYDELPAFMKAVAGECVITVMYGALSGIHDDLWYKPMSVGTKWLDRFLRESAEKGIVEPGHTDLVLMLPAGQELTLCHEGDVHVRAATAEDAEAFVSTTAFRNLVGSASFTKRG